MVAACGTGKCQHLLILLFRERKNSPRKSIQELFEFALPLFPYKLPELLIYDGVVGNSPF
jgi:hypothetical protein